MVRVEKQPGDRRLPGVHKALGPVTSCRNDLDHSRVLSNSNFHLSDSNICIKLFNGYFNIHAFSISLKMFLFIYKYALIR